MLEFWFNPRITALHKCLIFLVTAAATALLYALSALPLDAILMFAGNGLVFLICRYCQTYFPRVQHTNFLARLCKWLPIALLLALIFMHIQHEERLILGAQGIGVMALAVFLFSPLSKLQQHTDEPTDHA